MAGGSGGRSLEETPTWAVALVCFVLLLISIFIEHIIHLIGKWLKKKHKKALYESLEKIKSELMLLGFISLLLTVGQGPISRICVSEKLASTWHPCSREEESSSPQEESEHETIGRRRLLAAGATDEYCAAQGKVPLVSSHGIHQLHIFIFVLAVFHVLYCILTLALGRAKMRRWKRWEEETKTPEYQFTHDPERFRLTRETSFGRRHLSVWTTNPILIWIVCFFRQFIRSVPKVDYLTLRHGFMMAHLSPQSHQKFDFRQYIKRTLDEDFKVVVEISPAIWSITVLFLLFNTHGWYSYLWLPFVPLIIVVVVGTKLQVIITKMGLRIQDRGEIVKGVPVVQPGDDLFWFRKPRLILYLINFVLFQNAFQLAFFSWTAVQFGFRSCFYSQIEDVVIRITMGILVQILCSYVTLPLYALVTQMGSTMKPAIFNERIAKALRKWHHKARKNIRHNRGSVSASPMSSRPTTPTHPMSPTPLLRYYRTEMDYFPSSPMRSNDTDSISSSSSHRYKARAQTSSSSRSSSSSIQRYEMEMGQVAQAHDQQQLFNDEPASVVMASAPLPTQHEIDIEHEHEHLHSKEFSFARTIIR